MTKQEKIKDAYREWWHRVEDFVDEHGWLNKDYFNHSNFTYEDIFATIDFVHDNSTDEMIPEEIHGIRNNNGWHCLSEKDFPEDELTVLWYNENNGEFENASLLHCDFNFEEYTHWHELPTKAPIY